LVIVLAASRVYSTALPKLGQTVAPTAVIARHSRTLKLVLDNILCKRFFSLMIAYDDGESEQ
jgi:hypothetical protein